MLRALGDSALATFRVQFARSLGSAARLHQLRAPRAVGPRAAALGEPTASTEPAKSNMVTA